MAVIVMGSVSAVNITVNNTTGTADTIQGYISGSGSEDLSSGDTLTFTTGNYTFNKGVVINKSITINGNGAIIRAGPNVDRSDDGNSISNYGIHITAPNVIINNLTIVGFYYGISVNATSNTNIFNCDINNNRRGIELTNVDGVYINNTKMNLNQREGINFGGNNVIINNSVMNNNGYEGVHGHASNSGIYNSIINVNGFGPLGTSTMPGLDLHGHGDSVANFTLDNIAANGNAGAGLALNIQKATVTNSIFAYNNGNGISIKSSNYNATDNLIDGNLIFNNKRNGIEINSGGANQSGGYSASGNTISNNYIFNNKLIAVQINKIAPNRNGTGSIVENNTFEDNIFSANGLDDILDNGGVNTVDTNNIKSFIYQNFAVDNTWTWEEIQYIIFGKPVFDSGEYYVLGIGNTITFAAELYEYANGFLIDRSINIIASGAEFKGQNINQAATLARQVGGHGLLHGLHIVANNVNLTGGSFSGFFYGISVNASSNIKITDVFTNFNRRGIELTNVNGVIIDNAEMNNNTREGINFGGNNIHITGSKINGNLMEGVHGHASNSGIYNSIINDNGYGAGRNMTYPGIDLHGHGEGVANFTLEGNTINGNAGNGLDLNIQKATVRNNTFSNNSRNGISVKAANYDANDNLIDGNIITNNDGNGIEFNSAGTSQNGEYSASGNVISNNLIDGNLKNGIVLNKVAPGRTGTGSIVEKNLLILNTITNNGEVAIVNTGDHNMGLYNIMSGNANGEGDNLNTDTVVYVDKPVERIVHVDRHVTNTVTNTVTKTLTKDVVVVSTVKTSKSRVKKGKTIKVTVRLKNFGKDKSNTIKVYNKYTKKTLSAILSSGKSKTLKFTVKINKKGINTIPIYINGKLFATVKVRGL